MIDLAFSYMKLHPIHGVLCEFGVWQGAGLSSIRQCSREYLGGSIPIYGFDSFTGMPPTSVIFTNDHKEDWKPGTYSNTSMELVHERVPDAILIKGVFSTIPSLHLCGIERVRFARLDCDIYEGYRDALNLLTPTLQPGSVLLFDEAVAPDDPRYHDSIRDSGERAVREWQDHTHIRLKVLNSHWTECLTVVEAMPANQS